MSKTQVNYNRFKIMSKDIPVVEIYLDRDTFNLEVINLISPNPFGIPYERCTKRDIFLFAYHQTYESRSNISEYLHGQLINKHASYWNKSRRKKGTNAEKILKHLASLRSEYWEDFRMMRGTSHRNSFWIQYEGEEIDYITEIKTSLFLQGKDYTSKLIPIIRKE